MRNWSGHLPQIQLMLNSLPRGDGLCPFQTLFLRLPKLLNKTLTNNNVAEWLADKNDAVKEFWSLQSTLLAEKRLTSYNKKRASHDEFSPGTVVYAFERGSRTDKWLPKRRGPYTVARRDSIGNYVLRDDHGSEIEKKYKPHELRELLVEGEACQGI